MRAPQKAQAPNQCGAGCGGHAGFSSDGFQPWVFLPLAKGRNDICTRIYLTSAWSIAFFHLHFYGDDMMISSPPSIFFKSTSFPSFRLAKLSIYPLPGVSFPFHSVLCFIMASTPDAAIPTPGSIIVHPPPGMSVEQFQSLQKEIGMTASRACANDK